MRTNWKGKNGEHPFGDAGQLIFLGFFLIVWVGDSFFLRISTSPSDYLPLFIRLILFVFSVSAAVYLVGSGHRVVGREKRLCDMVTSGAFRYVRHPLYLGTLLFCLGLSVSTGSLLSLGSLAGLGLFYDYIAGYEEKLLLERFGKGYADYMKRTGKWLPRRRT